MTREKSQKKLIEIIGKYIIVKEVIKHIYKYLIKNQRYNVFI